MPPSRKTLIAILEGLDAAELDAAYARQRSAQMNGELHKDELTGLAVDGKAQRGTADKRAGTRTRHRMGAFLHTDAIMVATLVRWLGMFAGTGHAARLRGRPQRCCCSLRMRARSRRCSAKTSGCLALALRHRR